METSRWAQLAPLSGVATVLLLVAGALVIGNYDYLPPGEDVAAFFDESATRVTIGAYLFYLAAFFLFVFAGAVRSRLRVAEGDSGLFSAVAFAGGVAAATVSVVGGSLMLAASQRAGAAGGIGTDSAVALFDVYGQLYGSGLGVSFAVFMAATAIVAFSTRVVPAWLAWVSAIGAIGLLTPLGYVFLAVAMIWMLALAYVLYTGAPQAAATERNR